LQLEWISANCGSRDRSCIREALIAGNVVARADLLRRAEAQGVKPFTSLEDFADNPKLTADFDVDKFLRQVRKDRDRPSGRTRREFCNSASGSSSS